MYILLEEGMAMFPGDEYLDEEDIAWKPVDVFINKVFTEGFHLPVRRKINTVEELFTSYNSRNPK